MARHLLHGRQDAAVGEAGVDQLLADHAPPGDGEVVHRAPPPSGVREAVPLEVLHLLVQAVVGQVDHQGRQADVALLHGAVVGAVFLGPGGALAADPEVGLAVGIDLVGDDVLVDPAAQAGDPDALDVARAGRRGC